MELPTLYAYDQKGRIREWSVHTEGDKVVVTHGLQGGKQQTKITTSKAKNIGRSNETTPEEQAELDAHSKWTHQKVREDYNEDVEQSGLQLRPMKALTYVDVPHRVDWSQVVTQPKLDGMRLMAGKLKPDSTEHEMLTKKGDVFVLPHLNKPTKDLLDIVNSLVDGKCRSLDGEVYKHGLTLQEINSLARRYQPGKTENLEYWVFDLAIPDMSFADRYGILVRAMEIWNTEGQIVVAPCATCASENEMKYLQGRYTQDGFEGTMIRHLEGEYGFGIRSAHLFKYKEFKDTEALIIGIWEDQNGNAMLKCRLKNGVELDVTPKRTFDVRKQMLTEQDKWIGNWITVRYQTETPDGSLQFPTGRDLRECDDDGNPLT